MSAGLREYQSGYGGTGMDQRVRLSRLIENLGHGAEELRGAKQGDEDG